MVVISPVMSRGFGLPVNVQSRTPKVAESTVNTTYRPLTRKLLPTPAAGTVTFWSPERPSTENPPPSHPAEEAAKASCGVKQNKNAAHAATATAHLTIRLLIRASGVFPQRGIRHLRPGRRYTFLRDDDFVGVVGWRRGQVDHRAMPQACAPSSR